MEDLTGYEASGLKKSLHGTIYQLKLLMSVAYQANKNSYKFLLATEMDAAGKFDDVVIQILNEKNLSLMYQAKHFQDNSRTITTKHLLSTSDPFSLQRYFRSLLDIIRNKQIIGDKELTICTNIGFKFIENENPSENSYILSSEDIKKKGEKIEFVKIKDDDIFLKGAKRFKIKITDENLNLIENNLETSTDFQNLAKTIVKCLFNPNFKFVVDTKYERAVMTYIIDGSTKKLRKYFLKPNNNLPQNYLDFKDSIYCRIDVKLKNESLKQLRNSQRTPEYVLDQGICLSKTFLKSHTLDMDPYIEDPPKIARDIFDAIKSKSKRAKIVDLTNLICKNALVGHIFVKSDKHVKFSYNFINKLPLSGNLSELRLKFDSLIENEELILENLIFNIGKKISYDEIEFEKKKKLPPPVFPERSYEKKDVKNFISKLVFAVNQPDEVELGKIISAKIGKEYNLMDASFITNSFLTNILDWFKIKQGICPYKTSEEVKDFFNEQTKSLNTIALTGPTSVFVAKLREYNISFKDSYIKNSIEDFLSNISRKKIVNFVSKNDTLLGCLKIINVLDNINEYKCDDSYIFIPWNVLVVICDKVLSAFKKSNILIVECNIDKNDLDIDIKKRLLKIINSSECKRLIIISRINCKFVNFFAQHELFTKIEDHLSTFKDLSNNSQEMLKRKELNFQGELISLEKIVPSSEEDILDLIPIVDLISKSILTVGDKSEIPKYFDKSYYLERRFLFYNVLTNVTLPSKKICYSEDEFKSNSLKRKIDESYHLLKEIECNEQTKLIWQESTSNNVEELLPFVDENQKTLFKESQLITKKLLGIPKLILLSDVPGMGKSTVLTNMSHELKKRYPEMWIIKIDLNFYSEELSEIQNEILSTDEAIKFLNEKILKLKTQFEKKLFKESFNMENKIILMFDGLDEISPNYENPFELLIQSLLKTSVNQIWISTRSYMKKELTNKYKQFFFSLKPFIQDEREKFLQMYWQRDDKNEFAKKVLKLLSDSISVNKNGFTGIPLQTKLLGDYFKNKLDLEDALPDKIDLHELYSHFINNKFDIYDSKIITETRDVKKANYLSQRKENKKGWTRFLQYYSLKIIFPDYVDYFFPQDLDVDLDIINNMGICWIADNQPHFIHQTFAEYFIADLLTQWFMQKKKIDDTILKFINKLFQDKHKTICWFLNGNLKMSDGKFNPKLRSINENDFSKFLTFLVSEKYDNILWILLKSQSDQIINSIITNAVRKEKISSIIAILKFKASILTEVDILDFLHWILIECFKKYLSRSCYKVDKLEILLNWGWDEFGTKFVLFRGSIFISCLKFIHSNQFTKNIAKWNNFHQSSSIKFSSDGYPNINFEKTFMCKDRHWLKKHKVLSVLIEWTKLKFPDLNLIFQAKDGQGLTFLKYALLFKDGYSLNVVKDILNIGLENTIDDIKNYDNELFKKSLTEIRNLISASKNRF